MMTSLMPRDGDGAAIPALSLRLNGAHKVSISATSSRNSIALHEDTQIISLYATVPMFFTFGDGSITADSNDHFFPAGVYYDIAINNGKSGTVLSHVATLRADGEDGVLHISEKT